MWPFLYMNAKSIINIRDNKCILCKYGIIKTFLNSKLFYKIRNL